MPTVVTATRAPRRDAQGLPLNLPAVDPNLDFDAFVTEKVALAQEQHQKKDYGGLRATLLQLLEEDPINGEAWRMMGQIDILERAEKILAEAEQIVARGDFAEAYRKLAEVPEGVPQATTAAERITTLKPLAIEDELAAAQRELQKKTTLKRAHERFQYVLSLSSENEAALTGLREAELRMEKRKINFRPYVPPSRKSGQDAVVEDVNGAILQFYQGDGPLAEAAVLYAKGALAKAKKKAEVLEKRSKGERRRAARSFVDDLGTLEARYARVRTEISNDPAQAWAMLVELQRLESKLLPRGVESFIVRELKTSLAEAFAERGDSMFEAGRLEDAFQRWEAGAKLDPTHPKVRAGLRKLEAEADKLLQEAEVMQQRKGSGCERFKRITKISSADSPVHQKARQRALEVCR